MKKIKFASILLALMPTAAFAADLNLAQSNFRTVITYILELLNLLIPILFTLAFIVFFWGLSKFILNSSGNQAELSKGKKYMIWGILALFILVSFRAIISLITNEFELGNGRDVPQLPQEGSPIESVNSTFNPMTD